MKNDIDKILPIVGKKPRLNQKIVLFVAVGIMLILVGSLLVVLNSKKLGQNLGKTKVGLEQKSSDGQLFEIWGTVTKVTEIKTSVLSSGPDASKTNGAILAVQSDIGKEYQVSVNDLSRISKNQAAGSEGEKEELAASVNFNEIKNGDRIYLTSLVDLGREMVVPADKVVTIKWFETVVPK
jgi:hypothetical protein